MTRYEAHKSLFRKSFLQDAQLQHLMLALGGGEDQVRVVGGAVRNALRQIPVSDLDLACVHLPADVIARAESAGFKTVPTGIAHGTVTVIGKGSHFEVTTLREDIETDGRHALVRFGSDWQRDMERRDFTMNALCVDRHGVLHDLVSGLDDCLSGYVRFIGHADQRIAEDALRIIRFLRFSAHFGEGALDEAGLAAANDAASMLAHLSAERIQAELKKILSAPRAGQLSVVLRDGGLVFNAIGLNLDAMDHQALARCERSDWALRAVLVWRDRRELLQQAVRSLKFSRADNARIQQLTDVMSFLGTPPSLTTFQVQHAAYRFGAGVTDDALYVLSRFEPECEQKYEKWAKPLSHYQAPVFPIRAADLKQIGLQQGPLLGQALARLEQIWIESKFAMTHQELLADAALSLDEGTFDDRI